MTFFLKEHDVEFSVCNNHLGIIYKGVQVSLEDTYQEHVPYLRWCLGYNQKRIDYYVNGFMFKDLLYRNSYARELYDVPEFIGYFSHISKASRYWYRLFCDNSRYYCFEYCIPSNKVLFDEKDSLSDNQKGKCVLNQILHRLYEYHTHDVRFMFDHENPIIRLTDSDTMNEKYYVTKEEITWEML